MNVTLTGGKRKVSIDSAPFQTRRHLTNIPDEPQPNLIDNYRRMDEGNEYGSVASEMDP